MYILGIHDGHNASASLSLDGEIILAVQEERFSKVKNEEGFPKLAVEFLIQKFDLVDANIKEVAFATKERIDIDYLTYPADTLFEISDFIDMMENYWKPRLSGTEYQKDYIKQVFKAKGLKTNSFYSIPEEIHNTDLAELQSIITKVISNDVAEFMNIDREKIKFYDHHACHIMYGHFANPNKQEATIGVVIDAYGDGRNQSIWKIENDNFELLVDSSACELARLYRMITLYLRMKPNEHEFKIMGMAPYAKDKYVDQVVEVFKDILTFEGMKIIHLNRPENMYEMLCNRLKYFRFDNIAGGVQRYVEKILLELFNKIHEQTGATNFVFSGGVAMNVKANKLIGDLDFIDDLFVGGSSSDESLSIGACYHANYDHKIISKPLHNLYLGCENSDEAVEEYISEHNLNEVYEIAALNNKQVAQLLADGEVVARVSGKMEFGSRALGNRSILANPSIPEIIPYINELIKGRDFWMPFAATVLDSYQDRYLDNPKGFDSRFMAVAMDTKKESLHEIKAGTHPYDASIRPQILQRSHNEGYYDLIQEFASLTDIGSLLNTSYNLHGLPVVNDIPDAFHVFKNSGLKYLIVENFLFSKK